MVNKVSLQVGDKVLIVSSRTNNFNFDGKMDKWLNKVMTIHFIKITFGEKVYYMEEDAGEWENGPLNGWSWHENDFVCKIIGDNRMVGFHEV